jgi:hypothetical protein
VSSWSSPLSCPWRTPVSPPPNRACDFHRTRISAPFCSVPMVEFASISTAPHRMYWSIRKLFPFPQPVTPSGRSPFPYTLGRPSVAGRLSGVLPPALGYYGNSVAIQVGDSDPACSRRSRDYAGKEMRRGTVPRSPPLPLSMEDGPGRLDRMTSRSVVMRVLPENQGDSDNSPGCRVNR